MIVKLSHFDSWQARRNDIAEYYSANLKIDGQLMPPAGNVKHAWFRYCIRTARRDQLRQWLLHHGIESRISYEKALYDLPVSPYKSMACPMADIHKSQTINLPIYPELTDTEVEAVVIAVNKFYKS